MGNFSPMGASKVRILSLHDNEPIQAGFTWPLKGVELDQVSIISELRAGILCPTCLTERLDYDGLLNLACPKCGIICSGGFT